MQITQDLLNRNSEEDFSSALFRLSDSGVSLIHVRAREVVRAQFALRKAITLLGDNEYHEWNVLDGMRTFTIQNMRNANVAGDGIVDIGMAIRAPGEKFVSGTPDGKTWFYVFVNPQYWVERNPVVAHHLEQYAHTLSSGSVRVIILTPDEPLPDAMADIFTTLEFAPPSFAELRDYLHSVLEGVDANTVARLSEEDINRICFAGAGMTKNAFENFASLAIVEAAEHNEEEPVTADQICSGVSKGKTEVVRANDLLELYPVESMSHVGGMENLKLWVRKRAGCFTEEAADFGIDPPKGMVFVGPPGTGKSLSAKAVASEFGVPLLRFDFGRVFNSLVGKSEERMRTALRMVQSMAPCVLFVDEIDKGLGGLGGSGDSGTSTRVFGTFLTWLQENKAPVFTMVTANNIAGMPPEMMRRGRFDAIFASSLPNDKEREAILKIHLEKRGQETPSIRVRAKSGLQGVINASNGYVGSEIEAAVQDGLVEAFYNKEAFTLGHVEAALKAMIPLSQSYRLEIIAMLMW